jgi:hypothetical protein
MYEWGQNVTPDTLQFHDAQNLSKLTGLDFRLENKLLNEFKSN